MDATYSLKLPPKSYRRTIEELSVVIPDPALKLKFLKHAINEYQKISAPGRLDPSTAEIAYQNTLLDKAEELWPGSKKAARSSIHTDVIAAPGVKLSRFNRRYELRHLFGFAILVFYLLWISPTVSPLVKSLNFESWINQNPPKSKVSQKKNIIRKPIIDSRQFNGGNIHVRTAKFRNDTRQVLKYLQNPILLALTPWKSQNSTGNAIDNTPILSLKPSDRDNYPPRPAIQSGKLPRSRELVSEYFQNPVLAALTFQPSNDTRTDRGSKSAPAFYHSSEVENGWSSTGVKSEQLQKEIGWLPECLQNPILIALASQIEEDTKSDPILNPPLLSSLPPNNENHKSSPSVYFSAHREGPTQVLKYFRNPILTALTSQQTINAKTEQTSKNPLSTHKPQKNENSLSFTAINPDELRKEPEPVLMHLQNPVLLAIANQEINIPKTERTSQKPLSSLPTSNSENHSPPHVDKFDKLIKKTEQFPEYLQDPIWLVEKTSDREFYSNRLQIITTHTISNIPREYYRFPKNPDHFRANGEITNKISGIVYHASESDLYPFMPEMNHSILNYSKRLIKYLLRKKSYHYFIDRFGRVYRLVRENHAAFHAGNSVWADDEEIYLNLNHAFIGICFEGNDFKEIKIKEQNKSKATNSKDTLLRPTGISSFNEAQLRSGKELTDWLRVKYKIPQHNCVPHALISVNPDRMLIGWHLDLSRGFPFEKFGLSDKYREPLPSMLEFGFFYDKYFEKIFSGNLWYGIHWSEEILLRRARSSGMSFAAYRKSLHQKFSQYMEWKKKMFDKTNQVAENH